MLNTIKREPVKGQVMDVYVAGCMRISHVGGKKFLKSQGFASFGAKEKQGAVLRIGIDIRIFAPGVGILKNKIINMIHHGFRICLWHSSTLFRGF